jgi:RNA polymerase sigma factor (sigma-70 family)
MHGDDSNDKAQMGLAVPPATEEGGTGETPPEEQRWITELVREHYAPALRYAVKLLRDSAEAEDCVQEAFAEAFSHQESLRDRRAAPSWIRSIVRHRCLRRSRRRDLELLPFASELDELRSADDEPDGEERPRHLALARRLVRSLPAHEREIVSLFYVKECSQREIASFLGLSPSIVNNRLHDARSRMKQWEKNMEKPRIDSAVEDRIARIGTVVSARGPWIEARFDPDAPFDVFDALAVVDASGKCVERFKVAHRAGHGRVVCLPTGKDLTPVAVGTSVLNTGKVGLELTWLNGVRGVSAADLHAAAAALRGNGERAFLATGIKAIDLLCPLPARGVVAQAATGGVGRMVLLDELAQRLAGTHAALSLLCLVERSEPDPYRDWGDSMPWGQSEGTGFYWALTDQGTDPTCAAFDACDASIYMSPLLAVRAWYPAIDPEHSRSNLLKPDLVGAEHCALAARAREELVFLKRAYADPVMLELLACRALAAARRRALEHVPNAPGADVARLARARKLQLFLTQPFGVVSEWTRWASVEVPVADTLAGVRAILDGAVDDLPEGAFAYAGTLDDVRRHARDGVARRYGE